jgi:hypothetical protein
LVGRKDKREWPLSDVCFVFVIYFELEIGFYPMALILHRDNTKLQISYKIRAQKEDKSAHEATQTRKGTLQSMNTG